MAQNIYAPRRMAFRRRIRHTRKAWGRLVREFPAVQDIRGMVRDWVGGFVLALLALACIVGGFAL